MKLSNLASAETTTLELLNPENDYPLGVYIVGYTVDSKKWRKAERVIVNPNKKQSVIIEKNQNRIELDSNAADNKRKLIIDMITDITGLDDWTFSKENVKSLFDDPAYNWIMEQWSDHLDNRNNFLSIPVPDAKPTLKV